MVSGSHKDEALAVAQRSELLAQGLSAMGVAYTSLPPHLMGRGHAFAFAEDVVGVVSVLLHGGPQFTVAYGVLADLPRDRVGILEQCNLHNQGNYAYPVHLHDADKGWDVVLAMSFPIQLLVDLPEFIRGWAVTPQMVELLGEVRSAFRAAGLGGRPYRWGEADATSLLLRTLL